MPWSAEDFKKKDESLTDKQAERAATIANDVLKQCLEDGALSKSKCEAAAIKQGLGVVSNMKTINIKVNADGKVREETVNGRDYLVAPVVAVKEGVLNYEDGAEFIPADEIKNSVEWWNGVDLPVGHPEKRGQPVSARQRDVVENNVVGRLWNAHYEDKKLKGELWVDVEKAKNMGSTAQEVVDLLSNEKPIDVSTAYQRQAERSGGEYNGQKYDRVQRNLRPDHLALLPHSTGNMSWSDGVGAPRLNSEGDYIVKDNASTPSYNGTEAKDWSAIKKTFTAFKSALDIEDESWEELNESERSEIREHFIDQTGDTFTALGYPVVNPNTNQLNRNAVANAKARAAGENDSAVERIANSLWDKEFAEQENAENIANKVINFVKNHFRGEQEMSENVEVVVENTGYEAEDLEDMDDEKIEAWASAYKDNEEPEEEETVENDTNDEPENDTLEDRITNEEKEKLYDEFKERKENEEVVESILDLSDNFEEDELMENSLEFNKNLKDSLEEQKQQVENYEGRGLPSNQDGDDMSEDMEEFLKV